jgi:hypothetical protein
MPAATAPPARSTDIQRRRKRSIRLIVIIALACVIVAGIVLAASHWWPFSQAQVLEDLREASNGQVQVRSFHETYFPSPGCILEGVVFHHTPNEAKPLITIQKLTIQGSYLGLISQSVSRITAEGMLISIPPFGTGAAFHTTQSKISTGEIVADGAVLEFALQDPNAAPLRFEIHEAVLRNVGWKTPLSYRVKVHNPQPPGEVAAEGKFGVWNLSNVGETPVSGEYKFDHADLSVYNGIAGTLSSTGKFSGKLAHIDIAGTTDIPDFEVVMGHHPVHLTAKFSAYVDATQGDTFLNQIDADLRKTHITAKGSVAKSPEGNGKTGVIDVQMNQARIEDLLGLFVQANRSPMSGSATIHAHIEIPPGDDFLKKIKLQGNFGVGRGSFSDNATQKDVDKLSAGARGESDKEKEDPETVLAGLEGSVGVAKGTASFSDLFFQIPGAHVRMHGTYNLINDKIDMRGRMRVDSKLSDTTTGAKAFLLKAMDPIFKKKKGGEVVPVRISGTYNHPTFGLDMDDKKHTSKSSFTLH